jgi:hypothetical protein
MAEPGSAGYGTARGAAAGGTRFLGDRPRQVGEPRPPAKDDLPGAVGMEL